MSKNLEHFQHVKSNVVVGGQPKLPTSDKLVEGEIAVNYAEGYETISIKNSNNKIIRFSSDDYYTSQKLGSGFTGENSANTVTSVIEDNELVWTQAYNAISGAISSHTTDNTVHFSGSEKANLDASSTNIATISGITSTKVSNWDTAYTNNHTHINKSVLDGITSAKTDNWDTAFTKSHEHSNKTVLDGITTAKTSSWDDAVTSSHTHSNKSVLDGITAINQVIDSTTSASTNPVSTKAVNDVMVQNERIIASALNDLDIRAGIISAITVNSDMSNVTCPAEITGTSKSGAQAIVIYENGTTTTDYTVTVSTDYKSPNGQQITLSCYKNGYCEISYINVNGVIYARGI